MTRPKLTIARPQKAKPAVTFSMLRKAVSLYRNDMVPREQWKRNAVNWISARLRMGDRHVLKGYPVSWGQPGEPIVKQVMSPRRLNERNV